ncbi:AAA family ATPase [Poseidonocella sp. HB161398]|uniref:AAA family ATPase n=1 Tax=Poseidonocella sp. HB161398 TaxID=2320855 RepID=UPI0014865B1A|nr:AAA family ATPase [Poseidonocella sp. HB161398]
MRHETWDDIRDGNRVHIFGPAGSGTSTLGRALAGALSSQHFDTDDFYWQPTDPPFLEKRPPEERLALMQAMFLPRRDWVLSGSVESWGKEIAPRITMAIHLSLEPEIRRSRLERREAMRCSCNRGWGQPFCERCTAFLCWADRYEAPDRHRPGRSLEADTAWARTLECPVLLLDSTRPVPELVRGTLDRLDQLAALA